MIEDRRPRGPFPRGPVSGPSPERSFDRPPFPPRAPQQHHSLRLRDGDRELEVSGSADFIRQTLGDLPTLLARLRGEPLPRNDITMPPPPGAAPPAPAAAPAARTEAVATNGHAGSDADLERDVLAVLRRSTRPLTVAEIRQHLGGDLTGQQVRRTLERATSVRASMDRPATYRLR